MSWVSVEDLQRLESVPCLVFDVNGLEIRRAITGLDPESGDVESYALDKSGVPIINSETGDCVRRRERYPAPLLWKKVSTEQARRSASQCWDLKE